jgi:hypothetical protein
MHRAVLALALLTAPSLVHAEVKPSAIENQLRNLRSVATAQRPAATIQIATDIRALPSGAQKVGLADALSHLVTEGDAAMMLCRPSLTRWARL